MKAVLFENKEFYIQKISERGKLIVTCFDLVRLWREDSLTEERIVERFKECNPLMRSTRNDRILEFVSSLVLDEYSIKSINHLDRAIKLEICTKKGNINIAYYFLLNEEPPEVFCQEITRPFLLMFQELQYRQNVLFQLLQDKDKEIQEYKLEGAVITRKNTTTKEFDPRAFQIGCSEEMPLRLKNSADSFSSIICNPETNDFYWNVQREMRHPIKIEKEESFIDTAPEEECLNKVKEEKSFDDNLFKIPSSPVKRERKAPVRKKKHHKQFCL